MSGTASERPWRAVALPLLLAVWFIAIALRTTPARYSPADLALLIAIYLCVSTALHFGATLLLRRAWPLAVVGALPVGLLVVWHLREQAYVPEGRWRFAAVSFLAALVYLSLARAAGVRRWSDRAAVTGCLAGALLLALLAAGAFFARPSFRWHLLRHNKMLGTPAYYVLAEPVDAVCEALWRGYEGSDPTPTPDPPAAAASPGPRPNLVVVLIDTLRADALAAWSGRPGAMPRMDAIAERGAVFTDVLANSSWTRPSVASLFTGLLPEQHGANAGNRLPEARETLAERLAADGYETAAIVSNFAVVGAQAGFAQGFERFEELSGDPWPYARADRMTDAALRLLEQRAVDGAPAKPLFLYLHYLDPHDPYLSGIEPGPWPETFRRAYASELRFLDPELERLIRGIGTKLPAPTYVVLTSDHGEEFGEHGEGGHGHSLYAELVKVPVVLFGPGVEPQQITARLEGRDFFDLLRRLSRGDAPDPAGWAQERRRERRFTSLYSSTKAAWHRPRMRRVCMRGIEEDGYFLIWSSFGPNLQLYRREDDPGETRNLVGGDPERAASMKRALDAEPRAWATPVPVKLTDETKELLQRLGYVE